MSRIFVNGINAKSAGGRSVLSNFLRGTVDQTNHKFVVLVPDESYYTAFASESIEILPAGILAHQIIYPITNAFVLPRLIRRHRCDLLFNLSDIPVPSTVRQIFLFDWSYAAFPESPAWQRLNWFGWVARRTKLFLFRRYLKHVDLLLAQNEVIRKRLDDLYIVPETTIVPNAVSLDHKHSRSNSNLDLGPGVKLLCLTQYYPHKNLEVFIPLAEQLKLRNDQIKIVTTISAAQGAQAKAFLDEVDARQLSDYICNIGPVDMKDIPSLFAEVDALLLPTLLESFSGTYVEAMYHQKPILTSDLDFAHGVCADCAFYFDPMDPASLLTSIDLMISDRSLVAQKVERGSALLAAMPDWHGVCEILAAIFDEQCDLANGRPSH